MKTIRSLTVFAAIGFFCGAAPAAFANGGPFIVKYPGGDPAAKGVLARLDPSLMPTREERLRVAREDLSVTFGRGQGLGRADDKQPPLATVTAEYHIGNPTGEPVEMDFGFPILRGIYMSPMAMMPMPDVAVTVDGKRQEAALISNSAIYGLIRRRARQIIEERIAADEALQARVKAVRTASPEAGQSARDELKKHAVAGLNWNERDAALLAEYAAMDLGKLRGRPADASGSFWSRDAELHAVAAENLGILSAIGEQKATQFLAQLATRFSPEAAAGYERIFQAWGGEVTERSVDLVRGQIRPREIVVPPNSLTGWAGRVRLAADPTLYARVDYIDENSGLKEDEKAACKTVLNNLPVVFTFAPMNLLHYRVTFPPKSERTVTVNYRQYAYQDTKEPASYQLAYVVHPASLWKEFGPISLRIAVPQGIGIGCSVPCEKKPDESAQPRGIPGQAPCDIYGADLKDKTGELFVAVDQAGWEKYLSGTNLPPQPNRVGMLR